MYDGNPILAYGMMSDDQVAGPSSEFSRLDVLIVEDEAIISFLLEDMLRELGCRGIRNVAGLDEAMMAVDERRPDIAVLDVNLDGVDVYPLAERLYEAGVPFVFTTGYGRDGVAPAWAGYPVVQKPFRADVLAGAIGAAMRRSGAATVPMPDFSPSR